MTWVFCEKPPGGGVGPRWLRWASVLAAAGLRRGKGERGVGLLAQGREREGVFLFFLKKKLFSNCIQKYFVVFKTIGRFKLLKFQSIHGAS
jgi:hypothetical protein